MQILKKVKTGATILKIKPLKIGNVTIETPTIMAPLAGITNLPFRLLVKEAGCGLVCSEMISANGLVFDSYKTKRMIESDGSERPLAIELFGSNPDIMAKAAIELESCGADIIDINFGCSVRKVTKTFSGSALMKDPENATAVISAVRNAISIPLTIKIRSGWDPSGDQAFEIAKIAQENGVDAIALHPRTAVQAFRGKSDWALIKKLKETLKIPVIGNGDIKTPEDALKMFDETGCDGVMIGRAAIGDPGIFTRTKSLLSGQKNVKPDIDSHFNMMERYLESNVNYMDELVACKIMRSRLGWFVKGLPGCSTFRKAATTITSEKEGKKLINDFRNYLKSDEGKEKLLKCGRFN